MNRTPTLTCLTVLAAAAAPAAAQPVIDWFTIDGGGTDQSSSGLWLLSGTVGQPDVGESTSGAWSLSGGFWYPTISPPPPCETDLTQDGNSNQDDIDYLIDVIAGGDNYNNIDPDFNGDGNVNQDDIIALINTIGGGGCP